MRARGIDQLDAQRQRRTGPIRIGSAAVLTALLAAGLPTTALAVPGGVASGQSSGVSTLAAATVPGAPIDLSTTLANGPARAEFQATLKWTPPASNGGSPLTGYRVQLSDGRTWSVPATQTSVLLDRLAHSASFQVEVKAVNAVGTSSAGEHSFITPRRITPYDTDEDGVDDAVDDCWEVPGLPEYNGCPPPPPPPDPTPVPVPTPPKPVPPAPAPKPVVKPVVKPAPKLPASVVKVKAKSKRSKLAVDVNPNKGKGYWSFQVQRLDKGSWKPLKTYKTKGKKEKRTVNLPKGTFRVVVLAKYGYRTTASGSVALVK